MKKFGIILAILFVLAFGLLPSSGVYADESADVSVTLNSAPSEWSNVFPTCTDTCLDNYDYLIISINSPNYSFSSTAPWFYIRYDGSNQRQFTVSISSTYSVYTLPFNGSPNNFLQWRGNLPSEIFNSGVTLTLTNSLGGIIPEGTLDVSTNGTYDVTNYASVNVNVDSSLPPFVNIVVDAFWKYHVAFAAAIPAILAIFFIFRFIKGRVR